MSWLRASRKVVDPDGVKWDVYVTRVRVDQAEAPFNVDPPGYGNSRFDVFMVLVAFVSELLRALMRVTLLLPIGLVRSRMSGTRRIEAIADWPHRRTLVWTVEGAPGSLLLDEVARGLERGEVPRPVGTRYLGEET